MTRREQVHNELTQEERRRVLKDTLRGRTHQGGTYFQIAAGEADAVGGRFATESKMRVTGTAPAPQYPALPSCSPWSSDPVPAEEALGVDLSAAPIVGETFEVEKSLAESRGGEGVDAASPPGAKPNDELMRSGANSQPSAVETSSSPPIKRRRRQRRRR